jgi:hypothetical protein
VQTGSEGGGEGAGDARHAVKTGHSATKPGVLMDSRTFQVRGRPKSTADTFQKGKTIILMILANL